MTSAKDKSLLQATVQKQPKHACMQALPRGQHLKHCHSNKININSVNRLTQLSIHTLRNIHLGMSFRNDLK